MYNFFSRLIGLFATLVSLSLLMHKHSTVETSAALVHDRSLLLIVGMIGLGVGLAMVLGHNVWSGGVLPVVVTLFGWLIPIRGVILLILPPEWMVNLFNVLHFEELFYVYVGMFLVLGLHLTYAGFRSPRPFRRRS